MELKDTVTNMCSDDYRERFQAEYHQLRIRYYRLKDYCAKIEAAELTGEEGPAHDCPFRLLQKQLRVMGQYLHVLEVRAKIEGVQI